LARAEGSGEFRHAFLERLMHYYHALQTIAHDRESEWVASVQIARHLNLDDSQVRRDLGRVGLRGHPRMGFRYADLLPAIKEVMGLNRQWRAVIVGLGRLGGALASYEGFASYGLSIVGLFDIDARKAGQYLGELEVRPLKELPEFLAASDINIGMITVPADSAQLVADIFAEAGVPAVWNFAPVTLEMPDGVFVRHEHISVGLGELACFLKNADGVA